MLKNIQEGIRDEWIRKCDIRSLDTTRDNRQVVAIVASV
jgi:hypothetical protein